MMVSRNGFRILVSACILACALASSAGEPKWIEVSSPNFTVISDSSTNQAQRVAKRLEQFRSVFQSAFPKLRTDLGSPLTIFAVRDKRSLKALIPNDRLEEEAAIPAGMFMAGPERKFVVFRTDVPVDQGYHVIHHEYVHMLMSLNFQSLPLWLSEGLAELFAYTSVSHGESKLGQASPEFLSVLRSASLIPLNAFMSITNDSPHYQQHDKVNLFYAQSWALVHYLMLGEGQLHLPRLNEFLYLINQDVPVQEAAEHAFGDLEILQENLRAYIRNYSFYQYSIKTDISIEETQFEVKELSQAESLAARGELLIYADRLDEARAMLEQALQENPESPNANQAMGSLFLRLRNKEQAQKYFSAAADLDSQSYLAQFFAAQMAYEKDGDFVAAEKHLRKAMDINPRFAPAFGMLSQILMLQQEKETISEALELAMQASKLEPADLNHNINVGRILVTMGRYNDAHILGHRLLAVAHSEADREKVESLLSMVEVHRELAKWRTPTQKSKEQQEPGEEAYVDTGDSPARRIKTGAAGRVKGLVQSVKCTFPATMNLVLDSGGKQIGLRAENYYEIQYWAVDAPGKSGFRPCRELQGKQVEVGFISVPDQEFSGLIKTVAIQK